MWQDFSAHHYQRGDVTAVVWGAPGAAAAATPQDDSADHNGVCRRPSSSTPAGSRQPAASPAAVDAEALTRGRRAATPFVQQCDLVFPFPDWESNDGCGDKRSQEAGEKKAEQRAQAFVVRSLGRAFYYRARGPLSALLREPFLGSCVLKGGFSALALNAPSDQGNSFAILPGGVLVMSLDRESFQTLGLPGEAAPTRPKGKGKRAGAGAGSTGGSAGVLGGGAGGPDRYVSAFHLASKAFRPGKPLHDRVLSCLGGGGAGGGGGGNDDGEGGCSVDMVVCWWGDEGVDDCLGQDGEEGGGDDKKCVGAGGVQGSPRNSGLSEGEVGAVESRTQSSAGREKTHAQSKDGGCATSGRNRTERQPRQRCREVVFPPGFSAELVDLKPDVRFFREACCPDLDFVGQGFASTNVAGASPSCRGEGAGVTGAADTGDDAAMVCEDSATTEWGVGNDAGGGDRRSTADRPADTRSGRTSPPDPPALPSPPPLPATLCPAPPSTTKCKLMLDMFDWLGAVACGLDAALQRDPSPPEPHLSEFETPRHLRFRRNRVVCRARLRGFLPPLAVSRFVRAAGLAAGSR
ncbi:unnamed protein product, partial [Scytosiphon promiscuus]